MVNHKKFMDIERIKEVNVNGFEKGDYIVIQEKIDGSNAAIRYDSENDCVVAQSRKQIGLLWQECEYDKIQKSKFKRWSRLEPRQDDAFEMKTACDNYEKVSEENGDL